MRPNYETLPDLFPKWLYYFMLLTVMLRVPFGVATFLTVAILMSVKWL